MQPRNVIFTLFLLLAILGIVIARLRHEPAPRELFDRKPATLLYSAHARCRMDCRRISEPEVMEIMEKGVINLNKSNIRQAPCPIFALQGRTAGGEKIRVIFSQCPKITKVITCYNLEADFECHCPGDEKKSYN